jgi:UDP-hydrolysing UDP-N-acetyl-D-glucosamine 2-epimerase
MRKIGIVSVGRSDYGIYLPILRHIQSDADLKLILYVSGMHLSPDFGLTARMIEADGFEIGERVEMLLSSDSPEGIAKSIGLGIIGFSQAFHRTRPDILVVLGDRFDMYTAALTALPFKIPVAHIHGGEVTSGALDDALRHSMTKLSHLHFVSTEIYRQRVEQLGEEPWRIVVSGAPGLDHLHSLEFLSKPEIELRYGVRLDQPPLLVTFHPVTLEFEQVEWQIGELLAALDEIALPVIFTLPNADTGNSVIRRKIAEFTATREKAWDIDNLGTQGYFSMMKVARMMVGNSSSGIIEAPSFRLPVVNIGTRQNGRVKAGNVVDTGYTRNEIMQAIHTALEPGYLRSLENLENPYGDGHASEKIVEHLKNVSLDEHLLVKKFWDVEYNHYGEKTK